MNKLVKLFDTVTPSDELFDTNEVILNDLYGIYICS